MLKITNLDVYYGEFQTLWDISLDVGEREIVALIGSNGAGKSTILKSIAGLVSPRKGNILFNGKSLVNLPAYKIVELGISLVPEGRRLFLEMDVQENLEIGAYNYQARRKKETLEWVYEIFPVLKERAKQPAGTLSGGEQQMVAIGRALMSKPRLLLIDEMSQGLAPIIVQNISGILKSINKINGAAILLVEQNVHLVLALAQRGYIIENGRIAGYGEAKDLKENASIKNAYLGITPVKGVKKLMIAQVITYGIFIGALYALAAVGLALLLGVMKYLNVAHGTLIMFSGYLSYWIFTFWYIDPFFSIPLVMSLMFFIGLILYKILFARLLQVFNVGQRINSSMLITFGLMWILDNGMTLLWTSDVRSVTTFYSGKVVDILGVKLPYASLIGFGLALVAISVLHLFLKNTYFGKAIRATTLDWEAANLMGINTGHTYLLSTGIALALSSLAGVAIVSIYSITPAGGLEWLMKAMIVMILAGEGKIQGILSAGIILGVLEAVGVSIAGPAYREVIGLLVFVIVLMFKPEGLFTGDRKVAKWIKTIG